MSTPKTRFAGIKSARSRPAADTDWTNERDLGDLHDDSELEYEQPEDDQTTLGETMYAGEFLNVTIVSFAMDQLSQHKSDYRDDKRIDLEITLVEDNQYPGDNIILIEDVLPQCKMSTREGSAGGRNTWELTPRNFSV